MRKCLKTIRTRVLALLLVASISSSAPLSTFATESGYTRLNEIEDSVGSVDTDVETTTKVGQDTATKHETEYYDETEQIDENTPMETTVYVTQSSSFTVVIPKTIILSGQQKTGTYEVGVKGDLSGKGFVYVIPQATFWMYEQPISIKDPEKAYITQDITMFVSTDLDTIPSNAINGVNADDFVTTMGSIECAGITAGSWNGNFVFNISAFDDFENPPAMASDGTILELTSDSMYIGAEYKGVKSSNVNVIEAASNEPEPAMFSLVSLFSNDTNNLTYTSDNPHILVDELGGVSLSSEAVVGDTATITATYEGVVSDEPGVIDREPVSVDFQVTVFDIVLSKDELELSTGDNGSITANIYPESLSDVLPLTWEEPVMMDGVDFSVQNNTLMNINVNNDAIDDNNGILTASVEDYGQSCRVVILPNHVHDYEMTESIAPDCYTMGTTTYTCKTCDTSVEGHSYVVKEPQLEHVLSDGHFCDLCDQLIVPYRLRDRIVRTVAGVSVSFICVDEDYVDQSGKKGAYFLAAEYKDGNGNRYYGFIDGMHYNDTSNDPSWANADVRTTLNGSNSDTTHIMLTDTTVVEQVAAGTAVYTTKPTLSLFPLSNISNPTKTQDYYFVPSIRELCEYNDYVWDFNGWHKEYGGDYTGDRNTLNEASPDGGVRTMFTRTSTTDAKGMFLYGDAEMISNWYPNGWQTAYEGVRPACVIEQDIDAFGGATSDKKTYHEGDVVYQTVAGKKIKFVCIDEDYEDASGQDVGALFLSTEIIGANDSIYDKESNVWATSDLRAYLNGANSVTDGLVQVDTTVKTQGLVGRMNWYGMLIEEYELTEYTPIITTKDYFFELSLEEMNHYVQYMLSSDGQIRDMNKNWADDSYGFYLRTPVTGTTNKVYYVYSDAKYYNALNAFEVCNTLIGSRPACVLPN